MWKQKTNLTEVDSPVLEEQEARLDPSTELPAPTAEEELAAEAEQADSEGATGRTEFDQLKAERDRLLDRLARLQAEFENARKRAERERAEYREYAAGTVAEQFLTVLDNLELALKVEGIGGATAVGREPDREADGRDSGEDAGEGGAHGG